MDNNLIQNLKKLKNINPNHDFVRTSRISILEIKQKPALNLNIWQSPFIWLVPAMFAVLLIVVFNLTENKGDLSSLSALNSNHILQEYNLGINIQLKEISYDQKVNQTIASALSEISDTKIQHLNRDILTSEEEGFDLTEPTDQNIDALLNKVIF
ncbi:hypothetical protein HY967_04430 [Candidatus Jorgensenbacteria bacterium]|nr:hypothetical protein [Candidatus Jorgensenbacteria bacterium]